MFESMAIDVACQISPTREHKKACAHFFSSVSLAPLKCVLKMSPEGVNKPRIEDCDVPVMIDGVNETIK